MIHPGIYLKEKYIVPLGLTVTETAAALDITRQNFSAVINGHNRISPEMALKLEKAFGTEANFWLDMQKTYDLQEAKKRIEEILKNVQRLV